MAHSLLLAQELMHSRTASEVKFSLAIISRPTVCSKRVVRKLNLTLITIWTW